MRDDCLKRVSKPKGGRGLWEKYFFVSFKKRGSDLNETIENG